MFSALLSMVLIMEEKHLGGRRSTRGRSRAPHHVDGRGRHPSTWTVAGATVHADGRGRHLSTWTVAGATYHVDGRGRHPGLFCNSQTARFWDKIT